MPEFTHASDSDTANNRLQLRGHSQVGLCAEIPDKDAFPMDFQDETQDAWIIEVLCQIQYAVMRDCVLAARCTGMHLGGYFCRRLVRNELEEGIQTVLLSAHSIFLNI